MNTCQASPLCKVYCARRSEMLTWFFFFFFRAYTQAYAYLCVLELSGFPVLMSNLRLLQSLPHHTASSRPREHFKQKQETSGSVRR